MERIISGCLIVVGIIHLLPLSGALGADQLTSLYGLSFNEPNIEILMRHRAVLFGILGFLFIYAAFNRYLRLPAIIIGFLSVVPFLAIALSVGDFNAAIQRVVVADVLALVALVAAAFIYLFSKEKHG